MATRESVTPTYDNIPSSGVIAQPQALYTNVGNHLNNHHDNTYSNIGVFGTDFLVTCKALHDSPAFFIRVFIGQHLKSFLNAVKCSIHALCRVEDLPPPPPEPSDYNQCSAPDFPPPPDDLPPPPSPVSSSYSELRRATYHSHYQPDYGTYGPSSQYFNSHPPVYEKNTKIVVWNCALHSASDVVFDCCVRAHIGGGGEEDPEGPSSIHSASNSVCKAVGLKLNQNKPYEDK
uniref:Uncharacterized protein n=1 Tax=Timema douglasi TaxID=61478 RepID=A0A7R8Z7L6_TIMDO|nr:unnamed protein product [Timema douglasi]